MVALPLSRSASRQSKGACSTSQCRIRNCVSYGGVGILVHDIGDGYKFVKRIPTWKCLLISSPKM